MWDDLGLVLPRNMMANWCIKISQYYLEPLYRLMLDKIKESSRLIHCDETTPGFEPRLISAHFLARWSGWRLH